mmetsp:Transcript_60/g.137  ORF Transcript_60/g.137 Transcript_60/m.137 type:complete len:290 (-) Transcript_60:1212-2081(-)
MFWLPSTLIPCSMRGSTTGVVPTCARGHLSQQGSDARCAKRAVNASDKLCSKCLKRQSMSPPTPAAADCIDIHSSASNFTHSKILRFCSPSPESMQPGIFLPGCTWMSCIEHSGKITSKSLWQNTYFGFRSSPPMAKPLYVAVFSVDTICEPSNAELRKCMCVAADVREGFVRVAACSTSIKSLWLLSSQARTAQLSSLCVGNDAVMCASVRKIQWRSADCPASRPQSINADLMEVVLGCGSSTARIVAKQPDSKHSTASLGLPQSFPTIDMASIWLVACEALKASKDL